MMARYCHNRDCMAVWKDDRVTICLDCGWGTREAAAEKLPAAGQKEPKANGNRTVNRHKPAESS